MMKRPCPLCQCESSKLWRTLSGYDLVRCTSCSFIYADMTAEQIERENFKCDDETIEHRTQMRTVVDTAFFEFVARRMSKLAGRPGRVLDVGCGMGLLLRALRRHGWDCCGLDPSPYAAKCADDYRLFAMPLRDLSADERFDVVCATTVLEHVVDPVEFLGKMLSHVSEGGFAYLTAPNNASPAIRLGVATFKSNRPPQHSNYFTPATARELIRKVCGQMPTGSRVRSYGIPGAYTGYRWFTKRRKRKTGGQGKKSKGWAQLLAACYFHAGRPFGLGDKLEIVATRPN